MKLYDILKEIQGRPKAIILAGAPGAGKGYILRGLDLGGLKILNVDDIYVPMLKKSNITLDLKNATPEERSEQAKAMAAANKEFKGDLATTIEGKESFILDGTAASYNETSKLKTELEQIHNPAENGQQGIMQLASASSGNDIIQSAIIWAAGLEQFGSIDAVVKSLEDVATDMNGLINAYMDAQLDMN